MRFGDKQAFACSTKGKTRVAVFSPLPSGQQGRMCDSAAVAGWAQKLEYKKIAGQELLLTRIINNTPDDERVIEQALTVRWGVCKAIAESSILHPLDGPVLREPKAGLDVDETGIDAWTEVARLRFGKDRRKVVLAMRGLRIEPQATPVEIEAEPMELIAVQSAGKLDVLDGSVQAFALKGSVSLMFDRSPVRAVRLRIKSGTVNATIGGQVIEWRDKQDWQTRPGVFGYGFLATKGPTLTREAAVFFDPPVDASQLDLSGAGEVESVRVLRDIKEWPLFEESEDFGETERPY